MPTVSKVVVTNFQGTWWGEGDDMIFIDGEAWPPSMHGTGSEDYFNQAWRKQENAFPMNGSSVFEGRMPGGPTDEMRRMSQAHQEKIDRLAAEQRASFAERGPLSHSQSRQNVEDAQRVRRQWLEGQ